MYPLELDSDSVLPPPPQVALSKLASGWIPGHVSKPCRQEGQAFAFSDSDLQRGPHGAGKSPTSIHENKQDTKRNFFNLVKGIHKPTVIVPFSAETSRTFSLFIYF